MAIPFKSPISFGHTTLSEDSSSNEFKINAAAGSTFTLGPHTAGIETGDGNGIRLSLTGVSLKSNNLSVYDLGGTNLLLNCNTTLNTFGNNNYSTMIKGSNLYLYRNNDPIIEAGNNQIVIGNTSSKLIINSPNITLSENSEINFSKTLTIKNLNNDGDFITPYSTKLSVSGDRRLSNNSVACISDINNSIINKVAFSHVWKENQPIIFVMPGAEGITKLEASNGTAVYTFGTGVHALIGIRNKYFSGSSYSYNCTFIEIKDTEFNFIHKDTSVSSPWTWKNDEQNNFVYISNYSLL